MPEPAATGIQRGWWFEEAVAGGAIAHPGGRTITRDEHPLLAWLTDNASEVHGNADRAERTPVGEPLVLGALSVAIVIGLAAPASGPPETAHRAVPAGWRSILLSGPVLAGDTLRSESRILAVIMDGDGRGGTVERLVSGRNQRDEVVVEVDEWTWAPARIR